MPAPARGRPYDGVVALGCVVRGETSHYDIVAGESARALMDISVAHRLPLGNGILTVENDEQARARASVGGDEQGRRRRRRGAAHGGAEASPAWCGRMSRADKRAAARLAAVQALYQMEIAGAGIVDVLAEFESHWIGQEVEGDQYKPAEEAFFRDIVGGVVREQRVLDPKVDEALARRLAAEARRRDLARDPAGRGL